MATVLGWGGAGPLRWPASAARAGRRAWTPMYTPLALPSRVRRIALFVAVLVIAPALALLVPSGADTAGAAQGQRPPPRSRPSSSRPETPAGAGPAAPTTPLPPAT